MVNGWKIKKLGDVAEVCMCKRIFSHQTSKMGNIPFYKIGTFGKKADAYISRQLYEEYKAKYSYPEKGDVLISAAGTLGRTVVFDGCPAYFQDSNIVWLKIDKSRLCNEYLAQYYNVIKWASSEGSTISRLYNGIVCDTVILLPPLKEQTAIAEALSDVDSLISSLQKLIEKKKAIKQGAMQELLTGKKRLPGFCGEWTNKSLGSLGELSREVINPQSFSETFFYEYSMPAYDNGRYPEKTQGSSMHSSRLRICGEVILFNKLNVRQRRVWLVKKCLENAVCSSEFLPYYSSVILPEFLYQVLMCEKTTVDFENMSTGTSNSQKRITPSDFLDYKIFLPEKREQQAIAQVLSDMDSEIEQLEKKLAKYQQIKQGMMQELLTGRVRLVDVEENERPKTQAVQKKQPQPAHNQHFDDAVMIAGIVNAFYSVKYPLGRKKVQKLLYLVRRKEQADISAFHKKAAGPYADEVRYKGGEPIAQKNRYIQVKRSDKGSCFVKGMQIQQALAYLQDWGKQADIAWLVSQFQYAGVNELELLATVDMAMCDLRLDDKEISVTSIKDLIRSNKEWQGKLNKTYFSDADIRWAIKRCQELFEK